ncbi:DUF4465 domain-containing protein [Carboxylicivirga taeanensis]|uniref:DUF4465 domain-containing protein n=1 Tax=Carboxylicivirga taeanensis TaxID=1416875 RepID=UPI003F6DC054
MLKHIYIILCAALLTAACQNEEKVVPAPTIYLQVPEGGFDFDTDSVEVIEPKITYDINAEYAWYENGTLIQNEKILTFENRSLGKYKFLFTVLTPTGDDTLSFTAHSMDINSFEEFKQLNDDGFYNSPESGFHQFKYVRYTCHFEAANPANWGGFALSNNTNKSDASTDNEFSVYANSGAEDSEIFMVYKQLADTNFSISFNDGNAHVVESIEVNNATRSYLAMNNNFNKKEGKDYFLLTINGLDATGTPVSQPVEFLLADYRPELTASKYIVTDWEEINLSQLGAVHQLTFNLSSSRDDDTTFEMPMYFCLDNLKISQ